MGYWVKYSTNWVGSGGASHPHEFNFITDEDSDFASPAYNRLTTYIEHNYQSGGIPRMSLQDGVNVDNDNIGVDLTFVTENRAVAGCNGDTDGYATSCFGIGGGLNNNTKTWDAASVYFSNDPGDKYKNDWHFIESYFALNSVVGGIGQTDGKVQYWYDGELVIDKQDVLLRTGQYPNMQFNQLLIGFFIGDGSPVAQTAWVDDLVVATGRVG